MKRFNRILVWASLAAALFPFEAHAEEGCTPNHELYRIVPEYRAVMLDGGETKRTLYVDFGDARLTDWKPGDNITFCDSRFSNGKMINTTRNTVATTLTASDMEYNCKTRNVSDQVDSWLARYRENLGQNLGGAGEIAFNQAKSTLIFWRAVCTDYPMPDWKGQDLKTFLISLVGMTRINMVVDTEARITALAPKEQQKERDDIAVYKQRAEAYQKWEDELWEQWKKRSPLARYASLDVIDLFIGASILGIGIWFLLALARGVRNFFA